MSIGRSGLNPLAYIGVEPIACPLLVLSEVDPTSSTIDNYNLGTIWLNQTNETIWVLVSIVGIVGNWIMIGTNSGGIFEYETNAGAAFPSAGIINFLGGINTNTAGSGNTITINLDTNATIANLVITETLTVGNSLVVMGGATITGTVTLGSLGVGVVQTNSSGQFSSSNGSNGQTLIGGGTAPEWANLTSTGGSIAITNGPNTINLESTGTAAFISLAGNTGTATNLAGVIMVDGGTNMNTVGSGNDLTISTSATPSFTSITTTSLDSTGNVTIDGTLTISTLGAGVVQTTSSGQFFSSNGTNGQTLIGGGTAPEWMNLTSTFGSFTITNGTNTINLEVSSSSPGLFNAIIMPATNIALTQGVIYIGTTSVPNYSVFQAYDTVYASPNGYFRGGSSNIFVGAGSGNPTNTGGTGGYQNVAVGASTLGVMTGSEFLNAASGNTVVGSYSLNASTTASYSCMLGSGTGGATNPVSKGIQTGSYNIMIGNTVGNSNNGTNSNNIEINTTTAIGTPTNPIINVIVIGSNPPNGGPITSCIIAGIYGKTSTSGLPVYASFNNFLGTTPSSSRDLKKSIQDIASESSDIYNITPVSFIYKSDQTNTKTYGLIAEEVAQEMPELAEYEDNCAIGVKYHNLAILILNEIKKLKERIVLLRKRLPSGGL